MELESKTKDELKTIVNDPKMEITDKTVQNIITLLNRDVLYSDIIRCTKVPKKVCMSTSLDKNLVKYNIDVFKKCVARRYEIQPLFDLSLEDYYRFFLPYSIFHEASHITQKHDSDVNAYPYDYLNEIYQIACYNTLHNSIWGIINYNLHHNKYFHERNADINASKLMEELLEGDLYYYAQTASFNHLFVHGYELKKDKVISPVERTFRYMMEPIVPLEESIPFDIAFENGCPITLEEYHYLYDPLYADIKAGKEVDSELILGRIKELTLKSKGMSTKE